MVSSLLLRALELDLLLGSQKTLLGVHVLKQLDPSLLLELQPLVNVGKIFANFGSIIGALVRGVESQVISHFRFPKRSAMNRILGCGGTPALIEIQGRAGWPVSGGTDFGLYG